MQRRVLVVQDQQDLADVLSTWLHGDLRCASVDLATDVITAVRAARLQPPDSIVVDLRLGATAVVDALALLRQQAPQARIIVHAASRTQAHAAGMLGVGADLIVERSAVSIDQLVEEALHTELRRRIPTQRGA
jgi:DNA-binding NarL/FixJ family response regulator